MNPAPTTRYHARTCEHCGIAVGFCETKTPLAFARSRLRRAIVALHGVASGGAADTNPLTLADLDAAEACIASAAERLVALRAAIIARGAS